MQEIQACKKAKGDFIQLLDADDILEPEKISLQVAVFISNPKVDLVYSDMLLFKNNSDERNLRPFKMRVPVVSGKGEKLILNLIDDNFFLPGCVIFRRQLFEVTGLFKPGMFGLEDWNYWFRAALHDFEFLNDARQGTQLLVRAHGDNMSSKHKTMEFGRIKAREDLISITNELAFQKKLKVSPFFFKRMNRLHAVFLNRDKARFAMFYGSIIDGAGYTIKHALFSRKPYYAFYDAAYWLKERIKKTFVKS